jgi:glycosyltransferase involved in cell wall biosynthesis
MSDCFTEIKTLNTSPPRPLFSVSVVIPCQDAGVYLKDSVNSALTQVGEFKLSNIVVVNDHSSDKETLEILEKISTLPNVLVVDNINPPGSGYARNVGVEHAQGDWIVFLDADDILTPNSIEVRRLATLAYPNCGFLSGDFRLLWEDGRTSHPPFFASTPRTRAALAAAWIENRPILLERPAKTFIDVLLLLVSATMVRRNVYQEIGGMDGSLRRAQDYNFAVRVAARSNFVFVPDVVCLYRQHANQVTRWDRSPRIDAIDAFYRLLHDPALRNHYRRIKRRIAEFYLEEAMYFRKKQLYRKAFNASANSLRLAPINYLAWRSLGASFLRR